MHHARLVVAGGALLVAARLDRASAQVVSIIDAGTSAVQIDNQRATTAITLSPMVRRERPTSLLAAGGTLSLLESGRAASQGEIEGSFFTGSHGTVRAELSGGAIGALHADRARTGEYHGRARLHVVGEGRGLWLGAGGGRAWDSDAWRTSIAADLGGWARLGALTFSGSVTSNAVQGTRYIADPVVPIEGDGGPFGATDVLAPLRAFHDAVGSVRWTRGALELDAFAGARRNEDLAAVEQWAGGSATLWLTGNFAVVGTAGGYPADVEQRLPGGRYATIALRVATRQPLAPRGTPVIARPLAVTFQVVPVDDSGRVVRMHVPGARKVELMGDFTDWQPIELVRVGRDRWEARVALRAGAHRLNVRIDDGEWGVPPGVTSITDDFSGIVGVLVVQ
jgi:hypothetical protein